MFSLVESGKIVESVVKTVESEVKLVETVCSVEDLFKSINYHANDQNVNDSIDSTPSEENAQLTAELITPGLVTGKRRFKMEQTDELQNDCTPVVSKKRRMAEDQTTSSGECE